MSTYPNFFEWLHNVTHYVRHPEHITPQDTFTFVMGNESCDLDSFVSSLTYAYLMECCKYNPELLMGTTTQTLFPQHLKSLFDITTTTTKDNVLAKLHNHHFIPLITVALDQFELRGVISRIVQLTSIKPDVVSIVDLSKDNYTVLTKQVATNPNSISFCLVDHNKPTAVLNQLFTSIKSSTGIDIPIIGILDHHVDEQLFFTSQIQHEDPQQNITITTSPRVIYTCASTTTVVVRQLYDVMMSNGIFEMEALEVLNTELLPSTIGEHVLPLLDLKYTPKPHRKLILKEQTAEEKKKIIEEQKNAQFNSLSIDPSPNHSHSTHSQDELLAKHQNPHGTALILLGDLVVFTIVIDSVGLEPKHGKRTMFDDQALTYLRRQNLLPPAIHDTAGLFSPMSPTMPNTPGPTELELMFLGQEDLTKKLFQNLSILLTDTTNLTIKQLFHVDSKAVCIANEHTGEEYNILFSAVPKPLGELIEAPQYVLKHSTDLVTPVTSTPLDLTVNGNELFACLHREHIDKNFDIILVCTYYQKEIEEECCDTTHGNTTRKTMTLQRELLISTQNINQQQEKEQDKTNTILQFLKANLLADPKLGVSHYAEEYAKVAPIVEDENNEFNAVINTELFVQKNSTLSRKYMLPLISKLIASYNPQ